MNKIPETVFLFAFVLFPVFSFCQKTEVIKESFLLPDTVFFRTGSALVDSSERFKIDSVASYMEKRPDVKLEVIGYWVIPNGPSLSNRLSQKRTINVAKILQEKYGIDKNRMEISYFNSPLPKNDLGGRCVIFKIKP
jgi:outer membrane protein OmpA-like peptidoglycan-associated protein